MKGYIKLKSKSERTFVLLLTMVLLVLLMGCGSGKDSLMNESYNDEISDNAVSEDMMDVSSSTSLGSGSGNGSVSENRKLIKEYYVDAETKEFDKTLESVQKKIENLGGYIENSDISGNSYDSSRSRRADLIIRIPSDRMNEFIETVRAVGNVTCYQESVKDITLDYIDTESHIKALETERDTLMEMLEQAGDLETLLAIQNELTNVRYELELYESAIRTYDQQISYGTITLNLREVVEITEQIGEENFFEELSRRFMDNMANMADLLKELVIIFISVLPFLLPHAVIAAVVLGVVLLIEKMQRRRFAKKALKEKRNNGSDE